MSRELLYVHAIIEAMCKLLHGTK